MNLRKLLNGKFESKERGRKDSSHFPLAILMLDLSPDGTFLRLRENACVRV